MVSSRESVVGGSLGGRIDGLETPLRIATRQCVLREEGGPFWSVVRVYGQDVRFVLCDPFAVLSFEWGAVHESSAQPVPPLWQLCGRHNNWGEGCHQKGLLCFQ